MREEHEMLIERKIQEHEEAYAKMDEQWKERLMETQDKENMN